MVAVAAGDPDEAQRQARKADVLLAEPPLTLLLSAQAAQLGGDEDAARRYFSEMLNRPETEFLGLRGLLTQALRAGDEATALRLAQRAHLLRPRTPWVLTNLLQLQVQAGAWGEAQATLAEAAKARVVAGEAARHNQAALLVERSRIAAAEGRASEALSLAAKAQDLAPGFAPAAARRALLLHEAGRDRAAAKAVAASWRVAPHPLLAETYGTIFADALPLVRVKRFETLAAANPLHPESHLAVAQAALAAQLWGEARRHLQAAGAGLDPAAEPANGAAMGGGTASPSARACRLMAELEEAEHGDIAAARAWLARAAAAPPDPVHVCRACAAESLDWHPLCPRCHAFDTLDWRIPARAQPARLDRPQGALATLPAAAPPAGSRAAIAIDASRA
jgi:HemY protein